MILIMNNIYSKKKETQVKNLELKPCGKPVLQFA